MGNFDKLVAQRLKAKRESDMLQRTIERKAKWYRANYGKLLRDEMIDRFLPQDSAAGKLLGFFLGRKESNSHAIEQKTGIKGIYNRYVSPIVSPLISLAVPYTIPIALGFFKRKIFRKR